MHLEIKCNFGNGILQLEKFQYCSSMQEGKGRNEVGFYKAFQNGKL